MNPWEAILRELVGPNRRPQKVPGSDPAAPFDFHDALWEAQKARAERQMMRLYLLAEILPDPTREVFAADYSSVDWHGVPHRFTRLQAKCVKVMAESDRRGAPFLREGYILEEAESDASRPRLRDVFNKGDHSAWGTMIVSPGGGLYGFARPT